MVELIRGVGFRIPVMVMLVTAIARFGDATAINIVYSSRGLWSVLAVWLFAGRIGIGERGLGAATLRRRLAGATLMMVAIVLVLIDV
jgi:hypothetical protein